MNSILQLKGRFEKRGNENTPGPRKLPANTSVSSKHVEKLISDLEKVKEYWNEKMDIGGVLVSVHYIRVMAKSNRLRGILSERGKPPSESIRGAKFATGKDMEGREIHKHVFTHYIQLQTIDKTITNLWKVVDILEKGYGGKITASNTEKLGKEEPYLFSDIMAKTTFLNIIGDCYYVEGFTVEEHKEIVDVDTVVTIYKTDYDTRELLAKFGVEVLESKIIDGTTLLLTSAQANTLSKNAPYLIAMSLVDFSEINYKDVLEEEEIEEEEVLIPNPTNEPVVGVIDTQFNEEVYFAKWVEYKNMLSPEIELEKKDFRHGTAVSSIIVDGPKGNLSLDDGCGRFRVRHFGVAKHNGFSSFSILKEIRNIVMNNPDIKVWNLSLGSPNEIKENFISPEAAELDRIQSDYDVIFVVAGTNMPENAEKKDMKLGSPADSLNSLVVNSVNMKGKEASYTRKGPVLSFFHKPDICYYGGDGVTEGEKIAVCIDNYGALYLKGTSFAAPWITRKVAYLIYKMGLSREVAKSLIIDSSAKWGPTGKISDSLGYGIVPRRIEDILNTPEDEIKFVIMGTTEDYETYNYSLPVPVVEGKHPFYARAVLAYFPHCDRNQGVDYTGTEMDIHFGRVTVKNDRPAIVAIDDNKQSEEGEYLYEESARKVFRKWDNIKRICEEVKTRAVPKKKYESGMWGIKILSKERTTSKTKKALQFGLVITLKEMYGKNRIDDFIKLCLAKNWLVTRLDVQNQLDIYAKAEEQIDFE